MFPYLPPARGHVCLRGEGHVRLGTSVWRCFVERCINRVELLGRLADDPEGGYGAQTGRPWARIRLITAERIPQGGSWTTVKEGHWVVFFDRHAENVKTYAQRGTRLFVTGSLSTTSWTDGEGRVHHRTEIKAIGEPIFLDKIRSPEEPAQESYGAMGGDIPPPPADELVPEQFEPPAEEPARPQRGAPANGGAPPRPRYPQRPNTGPTPQWGRGQATRGTPAPRQSTRSPQQQGQPVRQATPAGRGPRTQVPTARADDPIPPEPIHPSDYENVQF